METRYPQGEPRISLRGVLGGATSTLKFGKKNYVGGGGEGPNPPPLDPPLNKALSRGDGTVPIRAELRSIFRPGAASGNALMRVN